MSLFVKLCGIRTEADLEAAVDTGANAVGFVLTQSPRQISLSVAARLNALLPDSVLGVAVFHDPTPDLLRRTAEEVGPDLFQSELSTLVGVSVHQLLPVVVDGESLNRDFTLAVRSAATEMVLVDSAARGGTGMAPRWERLAGLNGPGRMILAGGLHPGNVSDAVAAVRPFGVDVSSGIESAPGVKDPKRMRDFVTAAREVARFRPTLPEVSVDSLSTTAGVDAGGLSLHGPDRGQTDAGRPGLPHQGKG